MIDGKIGGALVELGNRVAPRQQEGADQFVGFGDRAFWVIDEAGLHRLPLSQKARALRGSQIADIQFLYAGGAIGQLGFGLLFRAMHADGAVVLRPELIAQRQRMFLAPFQVDAHDNANDHDNHNHGNDESWIHKTEVHGTLLLIAGPRRERWGWGASSAGLER